MISGSAKNYVAPRRAWEHQDAPDQGLAPLATSCRPSGADGRSPGGTTESLRVRSAIQSSLRGCEFLLNGRQAFDP